MAEGNSPRPYVPGWQGPLINEVVNANNDFDETYSITYPSGMNELLFTLQNSNGRTLATATVPRAQFNGGAVYLGFTTFLTSPQENNYINYVVIDVGGTQVEFAGTHWNTIGNIRLRIYWK